MGLFHPVRGQDRIAIKSSNIEPPGSPIHLSDCIGQKLTGMFFKGTTSSRYLGLCNPYFLWRHVERDRPEVDLLVRVDARHHEEQTRTLRTAGPQPTQTEDDGSLIFLDHLKNEPKGQVRSDQVKPKRKHILKNYTTLIDFDHSKCYHSFKVTIFQNTVWIYYCLPLKQFIKTLNVIICLLLSDKTLLK